MSTTTAPPGSVTFTDPRSWKFWQSSLAGNPSEAIHVGEPCTGFWRIRDGVKGPMIPVAIWYEGDELHCIIGDGDWHHGYPNDLPQRVLDIWPWCSPITHEQYDYWIKHKRFENESEVVARADPKPATPDPAPTGGSRDQAVTLGHNLPPAEGSLEWFRERVAELVREAEKLISQGPAKSQEAADRAAAVADRLTKVFNSKPLELAKDDPVFTEDLKTHVRTYHDRMAGWKEAIRPAAIYTQLKLAVITPFLVAQRERQQTKPADFGERGTAPAPKAGGTQGRAMSLQSKKFAVIDDYQKCLAHFAENVKVKELILKLADNSVRAGSIPPGCHEESRDKAV